MASTKSVYVRGKLGNTTSALGSRGDDGAPSGLSQIVRTRLQLWWPSPFRHPIAIDCYLTHGDARFLYLFIVKEMCLLINEERLIKTLSFKQLIMTLRPSIFRVTPCSRVTPGEKGQVRGYLQFLSYKYPRKP